jgi:hypothetical protein
MDIPGDALSDSGDIAAGSETDDEVLEWRICVGSMGEKSMTEWYIQYKCPTAYATESNKHNSKEDPTTLVPSRDRNVDAPRSSFH